MKKDLKSLVKYLVVLAFPFIGCILYCFIRNISFNDFFLPDSYNNDTLFYYKLVEAVLNGGIPKGYYGFNESHALIGSFAAWSPVILIPWTIWGFIFGWTYNSMIIANVTFFAISLCLFSYCANLTWRQIGWMMGVLMLFPNLWMHLLVGLPETIIFSILIIYIGLAHKLSFTKDAKLAPLIGMVILVSFVTLIRPYLVVFFFLPFLGLIKRNKKSGTIVSVCVLMFVLPAYYLINHFLTAEYLAPMFDLSAVSLLLHGHPVDSLRTMYRASKNIIPQIIEFIIRAFKYGELAGVQYTIAIIVTVIMTVFAITEKRQNKKLILFQTAFASVITFLAIIVLLGRANEGGRHVLQFAIVGLLLCAIGEKRVWITNFLLIAAFLFFVSRGALVSTDYDIGIRNAYTEASIEYWEKTFKAEGVSTSDELTYDNTIIWALLDRFEGRIVPVNHRELYAIPAGMGISCCDLTYLDAHFNDLKSKYIAVMSDGYLDTMCSDSGKKEIGRTEKVAIYALR